MALFDKLTSLAKSAAGMTGDLFETGSMNSKIAAEKNAIQDIKQRMGDHCYAKYCAGEVMDEEIAALCEEIHAAEERILALQADIQAKKEAARAEVKRPVERLAHAQQVCCAACGEANAPGTKFCRECGGKLDAPPPCACGAEIPPGCKFCPECGAQVGGEMR